MSKKKLLTVLASLAVFCAGANAGVVALNVGNSRGSGIGISNRFLIIGDY